MQTIQYQTIGIIHSPFKQPAGMPIQPRGAQGTRGTVEVWEAFQPGLKDLDGFSHIILIYHFHRAGELQLLVTPFMHPEVHGVFATRAPVRPNPIGISVVRLLKVEGNLLQIENVDILDGTPLLDIKPYVPAFDHPEVERLGWLENSDKQVRNARSDQRFS